jgi:hypothetical protein
MSIMPVSEHLLLNTAEPLIYIIIMIRIVGGREPPAFAAAARAQLRERAAIPGGGGEGHPLQRAPRTLRHEHLPPPVAPPQAQPRRALFRRALTDRTPGLSDSRTTGLLRCGLTDRRLA